MGGATNLADLLERVLDKGVVVAGDIKVSLLDIELLTIQIRLVVCSIDKAKEMGMDWWANNPVFSPSADPKALEKTEDTIKQLQERIAQLESAAEPQAEPLPEAGTRRFRPIDPAP